MIAAPWLLSSHVNVVDFYFLLQHQSQDKGSEVEQECKTELLVEQTPEAEPLEQLTMKKMVRYYDPHR